METNNTVTQAEKDALESKIQEHLDTFYQRWQNTKGASMKSILMDVSITTLKERIAVCLGKYHQQVCNGGHVQWVDNGYARDTLYYIEEYCLKGIGLAEKLGKTKEVEIYRAIRDNIEYVELVGGGSDRDSYEEDTYYDYDFSDIDDRYYEFSEHDIFKAIELLLDNSEELKYKG